MLSTSGRNLTRTGRILGIARHSHLGTMMSQKSMYLQPIPVKESIDSTKANIICLTLRPRSLSSQSQQLRCSLVPQRTLLPHQITTTPADEYASCREHATASNKLTNVVRNNENPRYMYSTGFRVQIPTKPRESTLPRQ